ncbi:MAG: hypothetical protein GYB36_13225 [Alphaproteobacteria bacterium]|nr:hypothetical protein [Alphaproteobacteria bacterium]
MTHHRINALMAWFLAFTINLAGIYALIYAALSLIGMTSSPAALLGLAILATLTLSGMGWSVLRRLENLIRKRAFDLPSVEQSNRLQDGDALSEEAETALTERLREELKKR